jgi:hypothetical protein
MVQESGYAGTLADHVQAEGLTLYREAVDQLGIDYSIGQAPNPHEFSVEKTSP